MEHLTVVNGSSRQQDWHYKAQQARSDFEERSMGYLTKLADGSTICRFSPKSRLSRVSC